MKYGISLVLLLLISTLHAQFDCVELMPNAKNRIFNDISYLASDDLQGRKPGEEGAEKAAEYIEQQFKAIGLAGMPNGEYQQFFNIPDWVDYGKNTLRVNKSDYALKSDFFPAPWNSNGKAAGKTIDVKFGIEAPELEYNDYEKFKPSKLANKIFIIDISSPDGMHPHSEYVEYHDLGDRIALAKEKGAAGVILVNNSGSANDLDMRYRKIHGRRLPVIFISNAELSNKIKSNMSVSFKTDVNERRILASNVIGVLNNNSPNTVIIGAHYDHLGWGTENSLYRGEPAIHNGADDNASGIAGMLELARNLAGESSDNAKPNYMFIAFSGEEMGLLGSSFLTDNIGELEIEPRYMINLDMIGRMERNEVAVNGIGTTPAWKDLIREGGCNQLVVKTSESGVGPSDHTNFYYKEIPVLHFFTGTHADYHKPSDDVEKINLKGEVDLLEYILGLIHSTRNLENLPFEATKDESMSAPKFSVTLGVMPDYMFEGEGMRLDGVTADKPASKAGLQTGDVVVKLGQVKVVDMMSYMKALGQFQPGDEAEVSYLRNGELEKAMIIFK